MYYIFNYITTTTTENVMKNEIDNAQQIENAEAAEEFNAETQTQEETTNEGGIIIENNGIEIELF